METDVNAFQKRIEPTRNEALEAIQEFSRLHDVISRQVQDSLLEAQNGGYLIKYTELPILTVINRKLGLFLWCNTSHPLVLYILPIFSR